MIEARLYDANGSDRRLAMEELAACAPGDEQLLWVDLHSPDPGELAQVARALGLPPGALEPDKHLSPSLRRLGSHFRVDAVPVADSQGLGFRGCALSIVAGENRIVTLHDEPVPCLQALRDREEGESDIGVLSADSFAASLLDWHLSTYFSAIAEFELDVERLEVRILDGHSRQCVEDLRRLRRAASRLRRMLAPHRAVFGALSRPDFRPSGGSDPERHYQALDTRFERAMDMVEHARELVIGSFELFSTQTALETNRAMRALTFATVVLGALAVMSGLMGMNFDASFFAARDLGFWLVVGGMLAITVAAVVVGRLRAWI